MSVDFARVEVESVDLASGKRDAVELPPDLGEAREGRFSFVSRFYLPAFSVAALAVALVGLGLASRWGGADFAASMHSLKVIVVGPLTLAVVGCFLVIERLRPAQLRPLVARGHRHDVLFVALNATLVVPLITALTLSFSEVIQRSLPWLIIGRLVFVPRWCVIAAIVVAMDGCNWLAHLANHRVRVLWRFHELHHSQEDMSVLTVFRTHPLIHISYLGALVPGIVLVANGALPSLVLVIYASVVAFAHSNTNLGFGPLGRVLVSPNFHRIHHRVDGPQDVNLGFALSIWDQLAHRAVFPTAETIRADTGLAGRPLVVEQAPGASRHLAVFALQLVAPFRPMDDDYRLASIREGASSRRRSRGKRFQRDAGFKLRRVVPIAQRRSEP